jgi:sugar phosphate isomerase/epimerase
MTKEDSFMASASRRAFLKQASAAAAVGTVLLRTPKLSATPLGLPLGLQLYSVREQLPKDFEGTLQQLAAIGYKEVEAAGFYDHDAAQVSAAMKNAGLRCVSAHYPYDALYPKLDEIIEFGNKIGLGHLICSSPGRVARAAPGGGVTGHGGGLTLDDWRVNADWFNHIGEKVNAAGMRFGYHNHASEFYVQDGIVPYDELLRLTDPTKVTMEMDCGWVVVGGADPVAYFHKYPDRFSMLHVKDFKTIPTHGGEATPTEMGRGAIDYKPIFAAANRAAIKHIFVEQEAFDVPWTESLKIDADYMGKFKG